MTTLPESGFQGDDDRRRATKRLLQQARGYMVEGDQQQAGKKAWGAMAYSLTAIAEQRGWRHENIELLKALGHQMVSECLDMELGEAISEVFYNGHELRYKNQRSRDEMRETIAYAEDAVASLEVLLQADPRPYTIESDWELRRLKGLTGNDDLRIGDTSPVGFSLKHGVDEKGNLVKHTGLGSS